MTEGLTPTSPQKPLEEQSSSQRKELTGIDDGFIRENPAAAVNLVDGALTVAGVALATATMEPEIQTYQNLLSLLAYTGTTAVTKNFVRNSAGTGASIYEQFRSRTEIELGQTEDAITSLVIEAEGPVDVRRVPEATRAWKMGDIQSLGAPCLKIQFQTNYSDGTNDVREYEFGPRGRNNFAHWRRDRAPMQTQPIEPDQAMAELITAQLPTVSASGELSYGKPVPNKLELPLFVEDVRRIRRDPLVGRLTRLQVQHFNTCDAYIYLSPSFFRTHNRNGQFVTTDVPHSALPLDVLSHPSYLHALEIHAKEKGIDVSRAANVYSNILFFLPGTREDVIILGEIDDVEAPVKTQFRTIIADRAGAVLVEQATVIEQLHTLYEEFDSTQDEATPPRGAGPETATALDAAFCGDERFTGFSFDFYGMTRKKTSENERIVREIYDSLVRIGKVLATNNVYSPQEKEKYGLETTLEGDYTIVE
ncbi:hypothetical protein HY468_05245 [Candidatus Roizmanbacteria bacterium]|nr:hypothetical protein [Candidatus Roizmanbacteria bacterium]